MNDRSQRALLRYVLLWQSLLHHRFRPMFAGTRSVSQSTAVCFFASSSCVTTSKLRLSHNICHQERGVRGVSSVVCYAVLCPWSGGLCGLLCRVMPWSGGRVLFPAISRLIRVQVRSSRVQFGTKNDAAAYTLAESRYIRVKCGAGQSAACV